MTTPTPKEIDSLYEKHGIEKYLDDLRELGVTNMFGAAPYIQREFGLSPQDAKACLLKWMDEFSARHA